MVATPLAARHLRRNESPAHAMRDSRFIAYCALAAPARLPAAEIAARRREI